MNAQHGAYAGYLNTQRVTLSPRGVEYKALSQAIAKLKSARDGGKAAFHEMAEAIHFNSTLWSKLAADLAGDGNQLPNTLRAQLISLALFSQREGRAVMRGEGDVDALIDVNTAIMKGLRGEGVAESPK